MQRRLLTLPVLLVVMLLAPRGAVRAMAQDVESYKFDIGAGVGLSGYLGDANESNLFKHIGFSANGSFRYLANSRFAVRGLLGVTSISGNSADFDNKFPGEAVYKFSSTIYDLQARAEFNFFPYGIGETYKKLRRWTPYMALGLGCAIASGDGSGVALSLPLAVGVKFKVKPRFNLAAEFAMVKLFGDKADGITDPFEIKSSFYKNTDWYSTFTVSFSYEFGPRCTVCHRVD